MKSLFQKAHHLIRYFLALGAASFFAYLKQTEADWPFLLVGPPLYLAHGLKKLISSQIFALPSSNAINQYGFLLPITMLYFGVIGFQLKQLWNERGIIRTISLVVFVGFLAYIHYVAWKNLTTYFS